MSQELVIVETRQGIDDMLLDLANKEFIAYDCETTGLSKFSEVIGVSLCGEENKAYYVILKKWNGKELDSIPATQLAVSLILRSITSKKLIMHNAVFDCMMAENYFSVNLMPSLHTDTMVLAHLLDEKQLIGLKPLARKYFGETADEEARLMKESVEKNGGSTTKANYEMYKADSQLMAKYGAKDAILTFKLFQRMVPELQAQGLYDFFYKEESMPLLKGPTYQLNTTGLSVDTKGLAALKKQLEAECLEDMAFINQQISNLVKDKYPGTTPKNTFNIGSPTQLSWLLFGVMKLEFNRLTEKGRIVAKELGGIPYTKLAKKEFLQTCLDAAGSYQVPPSIINGKKKAGKKYREPWGYIATDKKTLEVYASKYKWIETYLSHQKKEKLLNTYVNGIQERLQYGTIYPSFLQTGTTSGRYSSRNPNFQNLPRSDKRVKSVIISRPGHSFVGADYSQLEPRVFAQISADENLLRAFRTGEDFYSTIGVGVYEKYDCHTKKDDTQDSFAIKYPKLRDATKVLALATVYGASARQLSGGLNKSVYETETDIENYLNSFPGVKQMMLNAHKEAKTTGQVLNLFGRPRRIPDAKRIDRIYGKNTAHADLPYDARSLLNLAVNHKIQSTAASIVNRSAIRFHEYLQQSGIDARLVLQVHDSLVVECKDEDAEDVASLLQDAMENTIDLETIALEAVPKIGKNLSQV